MINNNLLTFLTTGKKLFYYYLVTIKESVFTFIGTSIFSHLIFVFSKPKVIILIIC